MTTHTLSQSRPTAPRPAYHSRIGTIIAKELGDLFLRSRVGLFLVMVAFLMVPFQLTALSAFDPVGVRDPAVTDLFIRVVYAIPFGLAMMGVAIALGGRFFENERRMGTVEPLCAAGVRREDLVLGKLAAMALTWCAFIVIALAILAATSLPVIHAAFPILATFHPMASFIAGLALVLVCCGTMLFAASALMAAYAGDRRLKVAFGVLAALAALAWKVTACWPLLALSPFMSLWMGVVASFAQLPHDPRVSAAVSSATVGPWEQPHFAAVAILGAIVETLLFTWIAIRRFRSGVPNA